MSMKLQTCSVVLAIGLALLSGCRPSQWEIIVDNKGASPCSIHVTMESNGGAQGNSEAKVEGMAAGESLTLLVGDVEQTIRSIKIVRGEEEEVLTPGAVIRPGMHYRIVVPIKGNVAASFDKGD